MIMSDSIRKKINPGRMLGFPGKRAVALGAAVCLAFTHAAWADPGLGLPPAGPAVLSAASLSEIVIPDDLGEIESLAGGDPGKPLIISIQDAHGILEAQDNIRGLIRFFGERYGVRTVVFEGGAGKINAAVLKTFPDEFVKNKVMRGYLRRGEVTAVEMAAVLDSPETVFYGAEDWDLYQENYLRYLEAVRAGPFLKEQFSRVRERLDRLRPEVYSDELEEFHVLAERFRADQTGLPELLKYLRTDRGPAAAGLPEQDYPHLAKLAGRLLEEHDFPDEEIRIREIARDFERQCLKAGETALPAEFHEKVQAFQTGRLDAGAFLNYLADEGVRRGMRPRLTPELERLMERDRALGSVRGTRLSEEIRRFLEAAETALAQSPQERELLGEYRVLRLLENLASLSMTPAEWESFSAGGESALSVLSTSARREILPAVEFYRLARRRDRIFAENLAGISRREKAGAVIFLSGGFHAPGFLAGMSAAGYPYVSILPKIASPAGHETYAGVMAGNLSYKAEFRGGFFYDAFMRHAVKNLAGGLEGGRRGQGHKLWRDELLRTLAREGLLARAGRYTRYLDSGSGDEPGPALRLSPATVRAVERAVRDFRDETVEKLWAQFEEAFQAWVPGLEGRVTEVRLDGGSRHAPSKSGRSAGHFTINTPRFPLIETLDVRPKLRDFLLTGKIPAPETRVPASRPELRSLFEDLADPKPLTDLLPLQVKPKVFGILTAEREGRFLDEIRILMGLYFRTDLDQAFREALLSEEIILTKIVRAFTGSRHMDPWSVSSRGWVISALKQILSEEGKSGDLKEYLGSLFDRTGGFRPGALEAAEEISNRILTALPYRPESSVHEVDTHTSLNRHRTQYEYFRDSLVPLLVAHKRRENSRRIVLAVPGASTGQEMASVYAYLLQGLESSGEDPGTWEIEVRGMEVFGELVPKAADNLVNRPEGLKTGLDRMTSPGFILDSVQRLSAAERDRIFKVTHGNFSYHRHRDAFLEGADVVFANMMLHHTYTTLRRPVMLDIFKRVPFFFTNDNSAAELSGEGRSYAVLQKKYPFEPEFSFVFGPQGADLPQPDLEIPVPANSVARDVFDRAGFFLPTHSEFNVRDMVRADYDRRRHAQAVSREIKAGRIRLNPFQIRILVEIEAGRGNVAPGYRGWARNWLRAAGQDPARSEIRDKDRSPDLIFRDLMAMIAVQILVLGAAALVHFMFPGWTVRHPVLLNFIVGAAMFLPVFLYSRYTRIRDQKRRVSQLSGPIGPALESLILRDPVLKKDLIKKDEWIRERIPDKYDPDMIRTHLTLSNYWVRTTLEVIEGYLDPGGWKSKDFEFFPHEIFADLEERLGADPFNEILAHVLHELNKDHHYQKVRMLLPREENEEFREFFLRDYLSGEKEAIERFERNRAGTAAELTGSDDILEYTRFLRMSRNAYEGFIEFSETYLGTRRFDEFHRILEGIELDEIHSRRDRSELRSDLLAGMLDLVVHEITSPLVNVKRELENAARKMEKELRQTLPSILASGVPGDVRENYPSLAQRIDLAREAGGEIPQEVILELAQNLAEEWAEDEGAFFEPARVQTGLLERERREHQENPDRFDDPEKRNDFVERLQAIFTRLAEDLGKARRRFEEALTAGETPDDDPQLGREFAAWALSGIDLAGRRADAFRRYLEDGSFTGQARAVTVPGVLAPVRNYHRELEIEFRQDSLPEDAEIVADPDHLTGVFDNLARNARDAGARRMRIRILPEEGFLHFYIFDDGRGISDEMIPRVYELGASGKGKTDLPTGVGGYVIRKTVEDAGGRVYPPSNQKDNRFYDAVQNRESADAPFDRGAVIMFSLPAGSEFEDSAVFDDVDLPGFVRGLYERYPWLDAELSFDSLLEIVTRVHGRLWGESELSDADIFEVLDRALADNAGPVQEGWPAFSVGDVLRRAAEEFIPHTILGPYGEISFMNSRDEIALIELLNRYGLLAGLNGFAGLRIVLENMSGIFDEMPVFREGDLLTGEVIQAIRDGVAFDGLEETAPGLEPAVTYHRGLQEVLRQLIFLLAFREGEPANPRPVEDRRRLLDFISGANRTALDSQTASGLNRIADGVIAWFQDQFALQLHHSDLLDRMSLREQLAKWGDGTAVRETVYDEPAGKIRVHFLPEIQNEVFDFDLRLTGPPDMAGSYLFHRIRLGLKGLAEELTADLDRRFEAIRLNEYALLSALEEALTGLNPETSAGFDFDGTEEALEDYHQVAIIFRDPVLEKRIRRLMGRYRHAERNRPRQELRARPAGDLARSEFRVAPQNEDRIFDIVNVKTAEDFRGTLRQWLSGIDRLDAVIFLGFEPIAEGGVEYVQVPARMIFRLRDRTVDPVEWLEVLLKGARSGAQAMVRDWAHSPQKEIPGVQMIFGSAPLAYLPKGSLGNVVLISARPLRSEIREVPKRLWRIFMPSKDPQKVREQIGRHGAGVREAAQQAREEFRDAFGKRLEAAVWANVLEKSADRPAEDVIAGLDGQVLEAGLGEFAGVADAGLLRERLRSAVSGSAAGEGDESVGLLQSLQVTPEAEARARFLLDPARRDVLARAYQRRYGRTLDLLLRRTLLVDAFFMEMPYEQARGWVEAVNRSGRFAMPYLKGSESRRSAGPYDFSGIFKIPGILKLPYTDKEPVRLRNLPGAEAGNFLGLFASGTAVDAGNLKIPENQGVYLSKTLYLASGLGPGEWVPLAELVLAVDPLRRQLRDTGSLFPEFTEEAVASAFLFLDDLARDREVRSLMAASA